MGKALIAALLFAASALAQFTPPGGGGGGSGTVVQIIAGTGLSGGTITTSGTIATSSALIIGLWTGTCSSGTFLRGDGTCAAASGGSGTVTSVTCGTGLTGGTFTTSGTCALSTPVTAGNGGTGVSNTATLTLGTTNQNWATLGTGIVKNTTTTGALSDAVSSDVIGLWTGTCSSSTFLRGDGACAASGGSGTVTSVSFTGGLISVANPTTTPAFTVTGTSGGVPYFNASSTWASSAALASTGLVLGGGAGSAPYTQSGITCSATPVKCVFVDPTATTGSTLGIFQAGAGQSGPVLEVQAAGTVGAGTVVFKVDNAGIATLLSANVSNSVVSSTNSWAVTVAQGVILGSARVLAFAQSNVYFDTLDSGLSRLSSGIIAFGTGAQGSTAGSWEATAGATVPVLTSALKTCTASTGTPWRASVSDATAPAIGVALTGGGTVFANVHCSLTTGTYIVDGI